MGETDGREKKKPSRLGEIVGGMVGMLIMIYVIDPDWGDSVLGAGIECGLGWALGIGVYLFFHYVFLKRRKTDEIKHENNNK